MFETFDPVVERAGEGGMGTFLGESMECREVESTGVVIIAGGGLGEEA